MKRKPKPKKCRSCRKPFFPSRSTQIVCSVICAQKYAKLNQEKLQAREKKKVRKEYSEEKKKLKTRKDWEKSAERACNAYIRFRDRFEPCISCGTTNPNIQYAAGHFRSVGAAKQLRYNEYNIHKQCNKRCNCELGGNYREYKPNLVKKIGAIHVEQLETDNSIYHWTIEELQEVEIYYKEKLKELKKCQTLNPA